MDLICSLCICFLHLCTTPIVLFLISSCGELIFVLIFIAEGEMDYVKILNKVLPKDIRIIGWSPVPMDFHARYHSRLNLFLY